MLAMQFDYAGWLEAMMLVCFGVGWPIAILKTLRARRVDGKSIGFLILVLTGYLAGIAAKFVIAADRGEPVHWVAWIYGINAVMVCIDITLCRRFRRSPATEPATEPAADD